ncbi:MAG: carotenoid biosynthesis protein [Meiothermus sp.]|uniref:carotenoid biosynthesis protein n=1 Tax=Meiothermus sp. TaxID=1955249 RepID=UPI0025EB03E2|nr:carotenoid biosynthesis protein [Meiothermus sp.]MCS7068104.1 carotenoid biosynthesis protein [Meiothermus sp.]MDW8425594.1 carotenoid biosynthesis protein [Meiothermus sp.]
MEVVLVTLLTFLLAWGALAWVRPQAFTAGPAWLRGLGGLGAMGLALLGAVLLVLDGGLLGAALAVGGCGLALLAVWGGDLLWAGRRPLLAAASGAALLGGGLGWWVGGQAALGVWAMLSASLAVKTLWLLRQPEALRRLRGLRSHLKPWVVLLALAVLVRIPVPLWPEGFPLISLVQMGLISLAALWWGYAQVGARIGLLCALAFGLGLGVELLGSQTGLPFGRYTYQGAPPPTLLGVPLIVPLGWFALVLSAHVLAGGRPWLTGLLVVAWDLGLEALMPAQGYWTWQDPHPLWYGAPVQNYLAWFAVGFVISWLYGRLGPALHQSQSFAWAYRLEALFLPVGLALLGLWPAALVCGLAMNLLAWTEYLRRNGSPATDER